MRHFGPEQGVGKTFLEWLKRMLSNDGTDSSVGQKKSERGETKRERENRPKQRTMTEHEVETGQTPQEYVVEVLSAHNGELRQQEIIIETGWSRSSVSRLLCKMETEGIVVRVRLGAGNVVYLPETVPELVQDFESLPMVHI